MRPLHYERSVGAAALTALADKHQNVDTLCHILLEIRDVFQVIHIQKNICEGDQQLQLPLAATRWNGDLKAFARWAHGTRLHGDG